MHWIYVRIFDKYDFWFEKYIQVVITGGVVWHLPETNLKASAPATFLHNEFGDYHFSITATYLRNQWIKRITLG